MLNGYEITMLLMIASSFLYMMWRLIRALKLEKYEKQQKKLRKNDENAVRRKY